MLPPENLPLDLCLTIDLITIAPDQTIVLALTLARDAARCPVRSIAAHRVHSYYRRRLADLPWQGRAVHLDLDVPRLLCNVAACPRRIFEERLPGPVLPHGRRSMHPRALYDAIGQVLGGEGDARLVGNSARASAPTRSCVCCETPGHRPADTCERARRPPTSA